MQPATHIKRVLICEDEGITLMALRKALIRARYVVVGEETDGEKVVALARQLQPDLILMDIELTGSLSGLGAIRAILQEKPLPIVVLTAYSDDAHRQAALEAGVCSYLVKSLTSEQLLPALEEALIRFYTVDATTHAVVSQTGSSVPETR